MPISSQLEDTRVIKQTGIGEVIVSATAKGVARKVVGCFGRCVRCLRHKRARRAKRWW